MSLTQFSLENLHETEGGKVARAFDKHVTRAAIDCSDRPFDKKPRVVTLQVEILPVPDQEGNLESVALTIHVSSKVPPQHTRPISASLRGGGMLVFNEDSLDNVDQGSLPYNKPGDDD